MLAVAILGEMPGTTVFFLMSAAAFLVLLSLSRFRPRLDSIEILGLTALGWGLTAAICVSPDHFESRRYLTAWFMTWLIFVALRRTKTSGRQTLRVFLLSGAALLAAGIFLEYIGLRAPRAGGLFSNSNLAAALIFPVIPLCFRQQTRILRILPPVLGSAAILLTGSRAGLIALLLIGFMLWPENRSRRPAAIVLGLSALGALAWRISLNPESLAWFRWKIWAAVLRFVGENPLFGAGGAELATVMGPYRIPHPVEAAHWGHVIGAAENSFLGIAARIGIPGLLFVLAALGLWVFRLRPISRWKLGILLGALVFLLFHDFLEEPEVLWWWAAVAALIDTGPPPLPERLRKPLPAMLLTAALASCLLLEPSMALMMWYRTTPTVETATRALQADASCVPALRWLTERSIRQSPGDWDSALAALELSKKECRIRKGDAEAWSRQGWLRFLIAGRLGTFPELLEGARRCLQRAGELEPRLPWYPYRLARIEIAVGRYGAAEKDLEAALEREEHFTRAWLLLARVRADLGDIEGARRAFVKAKECRDLLRNGHANISYHYAVLHAPELPFRQLEDLLR